MHPSSQPSEARLWLAALATSVVANAGVIGALILLTAGTRSTLQKALTEKVAPKEEPALVLLAPVMEALSPQSLSDPAPAAPMRRPYMDTQETESTSEPAAKPLLVGERNTSASSNDRPSEGAPDRPALKGREMEDDGVSTYENRYREGDESHAGRGDAESSPAASPAIPADPAPPVKSATGALPAGQKSQEAAPGTQPVDRPQFQQQNPPSEPAAPPVPPAPAAEDPAKPATDNGLSRESDATKVEGSLTKIGAGSMDVGDTPRGRYTSAVIRTVERQWQANVRRNQEFNMSGTARVRVLVEATGKVRKVEFLDEYGIGKVQKGFILSSVRDGRLPPMPADLNRELKGQPIDLTISFIFGNS